MSERKTPPRTLSFDPESEKSLSVLITGAIADANGSKVTDLAPLRDAVDIDGVRAGIDAVQDNPEGSARISFTFEGYCVTVTSDGTIELTEAP